MKIVLEKGQNLYFTSDTHYGHSNICRATTNWTDADSVTRDFKSLDHMNDVIVDNVDGISFMFSDGDDDDGEGDNDGSTEFNELKEDFNISNVNLEHVYE